VTFWVRVFGAGFGAAALGAAAQLGVGYGLSAIELDRSFVTYEQQWSIQLTWIAFFTLVAAVGGTAYAVSRARLVDKRRGVSVRAAAAIGAGLGTLLVMAPLTAYPAINSKMSTHVPALTVALVVATASLAGAGLAALTVTIAPLSTNMIWFTISAWVLAGVSLADAAPTLGRLYLLPARLGVLDIAALQPIPRATFTMPALALILGLAVALTGHLRGRQRIPVALSGAAGPLLVAIAYLLSGPGPQGMSVQADAYLGAMIAVVAGLVPSVIVAFLPRRQRSERSGRVQQAGV
jgi:hypothetical protein